MRGLIGKDRRAQARRSRRHGRILRIRLIKDAASIRRSPTTETLMPRSPNEGGRGRKRRLGSDDTSRASGPNERVRRAQASPDYASPNTIRRKQRSPPTASAERSRRAKPPESPPDRSHTKPQRPRPTHKRQRRKTPRVRFCVPPEAGEVHAQPSTQTTRTRESGALDVPLRTLLRSEAQEGRERRKVERDVERPGLKHAGR
jgi:hypothetical protein